MSNFAEIRDLYFSYGNNLILSDLRMDFPHGKIIAIMGSSGSGKTTIFRLINGQLHPQRGYVSVNGQIVFTLTKKALYLLRRQMGMLFQNGALFTDMTIFENVAFPLYEHTTLSKTLIRDLVLLKLHAVGLRNTANLKPSEISEGMIKRVALARAIALDPLFIMYDEPFAGLDPISISIAANLIRKLNDALGSTSIVISHHVNESFAIADYIYLISQGKIFAQGTPDIIQKSNNAYVKQFLHAEINGPIPFHYPGKSLTDDIFLKTPI